MWAMSIHWEKYDFVSIEIEMTYSFDWDADLYYIQFIMERKLSLQSNSFNSKGSAYMYIYIWQNGSSVIYPE